MILGLDERAGFAATGLSDAAKLSADLASLCATWHGEPGPFPPELL